MISGGDLIYRCRKFRGYTQAELAQKVGVNNQTISMAESGNSDTRFSTVAKCLEACGFTLILAERSTE